MGLFGRRDAFPERAPWAIHEQRARALVDELLALPTHIVDPEVWRAAKALVDRAFSSPELAGSVLMLLVRAAASSPIAYPAMVDDVSRRSWSVSREDAFLALRTATLSKDTWYAGWAFTVAEAMLRRTVDSPLDEDEEAAVRAAIGSLERRRTTRPQERRNVRARLLRMLPDAGTETIALADGWSAAVLPELATTPARDEVDALMRHLAAATGSKPSPKWSSAAATLVEHDEVVRIVRLLVERLVDAKPVVREVPFAGPTPIVLGEQNADVARAAVWATGAIGQPWVVPALHEVAVSGMRNAALVGSSGDKVPNAAILTLGRIATPEAVAALQRLAGSTKHNGFRKRIAAALAVAAEAAGLAPSRLVERTVATGGLDERGTATLTSDTATARVRLDDRLKVTTEWLTADPSTAHANRVKRAVKELKDLVGAERRRVEGLLAADRSWDLGEWRRHYLDHPVTGRVSRLLIWTFDGLAGLPLDAGTLRTPSGDVAVPDAATVRLWHPASAATGEVSRWREWLLREGIVQPFKQAFREVYLLTPAERETATYSNRFAAHVLRYQQAYALFKERAWVANYLGPYDGGFDGRARHDFPDAGLTAVFEHEQLAPDAGEDRVALCGTDRVWFHRTTDRAKVPVPLDDVPPLVFSEAMRDVDLFVGVTSIALDPTWSDRGAEPYYDYWLRVSFGELSAVAEVRRDVLATLLPKLKVAGRVELGDRYVRVRGTKATYKVHLGSANVLIEPDDRYLCIVPSGRARTSRVMLPFEGDEVLSVVLSKVLLLAADDTITDPAILRQIDPRS